MSKETELLAEKRTHLAEKRTELAHERTLMAFVRTGITVVLFGVAFIGLSKDNQFLFYAGIAAIAIGIIMVIIAVRKGIKHLADIDRIRRFFGRLIKHKFKK